MNAFKTSPRTTSCAIGIAVCQALSLVPQLLPYQWVLQATQILFTVALGIVAKDEKKEA